MKTTAYFFNSELKMPSEEGILRLQLRFQKLNLTFLLFTTEQAAAIRDLPVRYYWKLPALSNRIYAQFWIEKHTTVREYCCELL